MLPVHQVHANSEVKVEKSIERCGLFAKQQLFNSKSKLLPAYTVYILIIEGNMIDQGLATVIGALFTGIVAIFIELMKSRQTKPEQKSKIILPESFVDYRPQKRAKWFIVFAITGGILGFVFSFISNIITTNNLPVPVSSLTPTLEAIETLTLEATETPRPTSTYSPLISCNGHTLGKNENAFYSFPSEAARHEFLGPSTPVEVIGQEQDRRWYKVKTIQYPDPGWMRAEEIILDSCTPNTYKISYLLGYDPNQYIPLFEETFSNGWLNWDSNNPNRIELVARKNGEKLIRLNGDDGLIIIESKELSNLSEFELTTSFTRRYLSIDGFTGLRLINELGEILEISMSSTCEVKLIANDAELISRLQSLSCLNNYDEYWKITLDSSKNITININDSDIESFLVSNLGNFRIQLEANKAVAEFNFLVINTPK